MAHNQGADKPQKPLWQAFADSLLNCTEINASSQIHQRQAWQFPKRIEASRAWPRLAAPDWPKVGLVVGIGASAGGLAAFRTFLTHMPLDSGMAFILVQHLDPNHPSMLVDLLTPHTAMPVTQAQDGDKVAANHI